MLKRVFTWMLLCILLIAKTEAKVWTPEELPMPYLQDNRQHVSNPDGVLSVMAVDSINACLQQIEKDKGVQAIAIAVIHAEGDDPYAFCMAVGKKYGIGARNNTGLIIFLASEDRSYQILTGNGLEGTLPDAICRRIQNRITIPLLKQQKWDEAMVKTCQALALCINGDDTIQNEFTNNGEGDSDSAIAGLAIAFIVIIGVTFVAVIASRGKKCPRCGAHMQQTNRSRVRIAGSMVRKIAVKWRCPNCGHEQTDYEDDTLHGNGTGGVPPIFFPTGSTGRSGGSTFSGGTFGGGTFGGGGSGGHF